MNNQFIEHEGKKYARVSSVIRPFSDFSHIPEEILERKKNIGIEVHKAIEDDITFGFPMFSIPASGYYQSFKRWQTRLTPIFKYSEKRLFCPEKMITGQIDTLVQFPGESDCVLIDFKTSAQESPIAWPMQAHLYYHLLIRNKLPAFPRFLFVRLDKNGNLPKVHSYKFDANIMAKSLKAVDDFWQSQSDCHFLIAT